MGTFSKYRPPVGGRPRGAPDQPTPEQDRANQMAHVQQSANWFFYIAGLSVVNLTLTFVDVNIYLPIGLASSELVAGIAISAIQYYGAPPIPAIGIALSTNILIGSVFAVFGYFGRRAAHWAFVSGIILYILDGFIFLAFGQILSIV